MEYSPLPHGELSISRIGFGGCPLGGHGWGNDTDANDAQAAVRRALDLGINFFDTADVYGLGQSETLLASALGEQRHEVVIATKFGVRWTRDGSTYKDTSPSYLRTALEASLRRLQVECIPLYYIHWPDGQTPIEDAMLALDQCRRQGKIKSIGLSNFSADQLERANRVAPVSALQLQYSLVDRNLADEALTTANRLGVPYVTWGSLAQGLLSGKYDHSARFQKNDRRHRYANFSGKKFEENLKVVAHLRQIAARRSVTPAQIAVRWLLQSANVGSVLAGAKRPSQIEDVAAATDITLSDEEYDLLNQLFSNATRAA